MRRERVRGQASGPRAIDRTETREERNERESAETGIERRGFRINQLKNV